jgi:hypothetical protein
MGSLLHHCNLDRLAAMWTASRHDTLQAQPFTSQGLYSTARGETITAYSPLKPFYQVSAHGDNIIWNVSEDLNCPPELLTRHTKGRRKNLPYRQDDGSD